MVLAIERYANHNVFVKAGFVNYFSNLFVDFRKLDLSPKLSGGKRSLTRNRRMRQATTIIVNLFIIHQKGISDNP